MLPAFVSEQQTMGLFNRPSLLQENSAKVLKLAFDVVRFI